MELLDIYDGDYNKTGKTAERGKPMEKGEYFLIVDVWIINSAGELLISKRTPETEPEPDKWQPTCGCAIAGDDSVSAALREVKEELGLALDPEKGRLVKRYKAWGCAFIDVWLFRQDVDINQVVLQPGETDDVMWAAGDYIKRLIASDKFLNAGRVPYLEEIFEICDITANNNKMVEWQLKTRGIKLNAVLDAMRNVPRHLFVPENMRNHAYDDSPLPIGAGQTISQPYIVAFMTEILKPAPGMKILEIGTGSGYQAAVLAYLGCEVYTVELLEGLADGAKKIFEALGLDNIKAKRGNGYAGWAEEAPFDAVIVTAAPGKIPEKLIGQLKDGGKMIIPVGEAYSVQSLKIILKKAGEITESDLLPVRFVPMVDV